MKKVFYIFAIVLIFSGCAKHHKKAQNNFISTKCNLVCENKECNQVCVTIEGTLKPLK